MNEYAIILADGQRKLVSVDMDQVFALCFKREWDIREWAMRVAVKRGWTLNHGHVVDVDMGGQHELR